MVRICPVKIKGSSTGRAPIQVNIITMLKKLQNMIWFIKKFLFLLILVNSDSGRITKIAIDAIRQITPPNLLGIDRRIA